MRTAFNFFGLSHTTQAKRAQAVAEIRALLAFIADKSGQDKPLRQLVKNLEGSAPIGSNGRITPFGTRVIEAIRTVLHDGKVAFRRYNKGGKLDELARQQYDLECDRIVKQFCADVWPNKYQYAQDSQYPQS